ncbi:DUF885 domain-containing protein [Spirosoma sordidisoli]|uniref:DUF885 domain-containing protein n=1 Tax=Spirosoma sordidisoli TaxID=2502893 RepID=A0A4Q2UHH6_9BACT|nr:DUF885 domain-containing protein [Spirosoma sordidisoli]RYC68526.1 DUF885 domain-containing protein [Spirosoma sordidisoli]
MIRPFLLLCTLTLGLWACQTSDSGNASFGKLADEYVDAYLASNPGEAVYLGYHEYDGKLIIPTAETIARQLQQLRQYDSTFARLDTTGLSVDEKVDYKLLTASIKSRIHDIVTMKVYEDPMTYSVNLSPYIERNFAPAADRARSVVAIARQLPAYFAAARQNLGKNPPREYVEVAIEGLRGSADYMQSDIPKAFASVADARVQADLKAALSQGADATKAFATYLETAVLPGANGSFAIGADNYRRMLLYNEWLTADPDSLLQLGMDQLAREKAEFAAAARVIDPGKTPMEVFKTIQAEHPTADSLLAATRNHCEAIRQFLIDRQIVTVPSEVRATITKTPEFMVGSTAAMNTPGPFERPAASEAYYYITLPKKEWTPRQQTEWLTLFNRYVAEVISVHEAYPGHYVQFLHLNASPVSRVRKMFASYAFVEGWAHYTEQMMLEEGFGQEGDAVTRAKYRMAQLSESMLRYCRLVCSIQLHTHGWTVAQATRFIMDNCYYEEKPAYEEARRGTFDPGYLSYSLGKLQLLALREEMKKKQGSSFVLKTFHDQLLDHGMPPITLLSQLLNL